MAKCAWGDCKNETKGQSVCCSRTCSNKFFPRRKKHLHKCTRCGEQFPGRGTCPPCKEAMAANKERFQYTTLEQLGRQYEAAEIHRSWWYSEVRSDARRKTNFESCAKCGYANCVQVCHIKGIATFPKTATVAEVNAIENLIGLCPNHHWELDHGILTIPVKGS